MFCEIFIDTCLGVCSPLYVGVIDPTGSCGTGQLKDKACNMKLSYYNLQLYLYEITHRVWNYQLLR